MLQDKLLQPGKFIVVRPLPHTPAVGVAQIVKVQHGVVHFVYKRSDESKSQDLTLARSDCEYLITHGMWTDSEEVREKPPVTMDLGKDLEENILDALKPLEKPVRVILTNFDQDSVRAVVDNSVKKFWEAVKHNAGS